MSEPHSKIWTHVIFATRLGAPFLTPPLDTRLYNYLHEYLLSLGCPVRAINGMPDHIHMLFLQNPRLSVAEIMKKIKGQTTRWINQDRPGQKKFGWEPGYAAFSVSESQVQKAFDYISNQKEHHMKENLADEYDHILELHGLKLPQDL